MASWKEEFSQAMLSYPVIAIGTDVLPEMVRGGC